MYTKSINQRGLLDRLVRAYWINRILSISYSRLSSMRHSNHASSIVAFGSSAAPLNAAVQNSNREEGIFPCHRAVPTTLKIFLSEIPLSPHPSDTLTKSRRSLTHAHQPLHPDHPIPALLHLIRVHIHLDLRRAREIPALERPAQVDELLHRIRLQ